MKSAIAIGITAALLSVASLTSASAKSPYDGAWGLDFATTRGSCSTYHFDVNITNGIVSHPNLVRFTGRVQPNGQVRASVTVTNKSASGSGRLKLATGRGSWTGYDGTDRCSGTWTAQKA